MDAPWTDNELHIHLLKKYLKNYPPQKQNYIYTYLFITFENDK